MSFIEYETWRIKPGFEREHDDMIRQWFHFVQKHQTELFPEWKSIRYFRQTNRDGQPTGTYVMLFEFHTLEGHHAYKDRRKDWSGPYADYKKLDPYQYFNLESVTTEYWQPQEENLWATYDPPPATETR
jgi:hypothetical protein